MSWINNLVEKYRNKENLVDVFGLVLYTDEHANIIKVLRDDDYWKAFHEISGPNWAIFSIKPQKGHIGYPDLGPGQLGLMVPVWKEPAKNKNLLREFAFKSTENLPLFLIFTHAVDEILQIQMKIDDSSIDNAYTSIKEVILVISKAIEGILPENYKNPEGVFTALHFAMNNHKDMKILKKGLGFYSWIKGLLP